MSIDFTALQRCCARNFRWTGKTVKRKFCCLCFIAVYILFNTMAVLHS